MKICVFGCISSLIGKNHLVIDWLSWLPNSSAFINYNVLDTLTDSCSTPLSLKILQQRVHELVAGCSDSPIDNFSLYFVIYMDLSLGFVTWICLNLN